MKKQNIIFVHADLDLLGLNPYQFRIYAHIARRGQCFSSIKRIAAICRMSNRKVQQVLKQLVEMNLVLKTKRRGGRTSIYKLVARNQWPNNRDEVE